MGMKTADRLLCKDFKLRGEIYEIWSDRGDRYLVDPRKKEVVDTHYTWLGLLNETFTLRSCISPIQLRILYRAGT